MESLNLRVHGNAIRGVPRGIVVNNQPLKPPEPAARYVDVVDNSVLLNGIGSGDLPLIGIDLAAQEALAEANAIRLAPQAGAEQIGIRLVGDRLQAHGNRVSLDLPSPDRAPTGIAIGYDGPGGNVLTSDVVAVGNTVSGCTTGISVTSVSGADVGDSLLEAGRAVRTGFGVILDDSIGVAVHDNRIVGYTLGVSTTSGIANRIADNLLATGEAGVSLTRETTPIVTGNRITDMQRFGIVAGGLVGRSEFTNNRVAACAGTGRSGQRLDRDKRRVRRSADRGQ